MTGLLTDLLASIEVLLEPLLTYMSHPWFFYQVGFIALLALLSRVIARRLEPRLEARARTIKANADVLRIVAALLRRTYWTVLVVLLLVTLSILRSTTWPSRSYLISIALSLALAWLAVAVLSRVLRNRLLARLVAPCVWLVVALSILGIADDVATALDGIAFSIGELRLSALLILKAIVLVGAIGWLSIAVGDFVDHRIQRSDELTASLRVLLGKLFKIGLLIIGLAFSLSTLGIDLTAFAVFSGAIGVGIGFGLQKVVSNFISGVIILLDRSIKPGDTISLGNTFGWIRELRARFVSVVTRDGREYLIPNEDFITREVINWSFSNALVRLDVKFGVSYESDPHLVSRLAIEAASTVARVQSSSRPVCWLTGFGDSSLDFVLRFWIDDPQNGLTNVRGQVLLALWDTFKSNGVSIPYPHRQLILQRDANIDVQSPAFTLGTGPEQ